MTKFQEYLPYYRRNIGVALPVMMTQLGGAVVGIIDSVMVGQLGTKELAASSFAFSVFVIGMIIPQGISMGLTPLVGMAYVNNEHSRVRSLLHNSFIFSCGMAILISFILLSVVPFMGYMGQDPDVVKLGIPYYYWLVLSLLPFITFCVMKQFLEGMGNTKIAMNITIISNIVNVFLNYVFIYGHFGCPKMGVEGAGFATFISRIIMPILFIFAIKRNGNWWGYFTHFSARSFNKVKQKKLRAVGVPIAGQMTLEMVAFALSAIMVGWLGAAPQAAHQITVQVSHLSFMLIVGIQAATTIRVSHQFGLKDYHALKMAGRASMHLCLMMNVIVASSIVIFRHKIPLIFSTDPVVIDQAATLFIVMAMFQISDGMQAMGAGMLRGITDVKKPMYIAFVAYICLNLPVGYFLGFVLELGAVGVWGGFIVGLSIAAILFHLRFSRQFKRIVATGTIDE